MKTLETDAEVGADGSLKLLSPLPEWLKPGRAHLWLSMAEGNGAETPVARPPLIAAPERIERRKAALRQLRELGGLADVIADPAAWQREQRQERPLPGRD